MFIRLPFIRFEYHILFRYVVFDGDFLAEGVEDVGFGAPLVAGAYSEAFSTVLQEYQN